jgi:hypothetical protein
VAILDRSGPASASPACVRFASIRVRSFFCSHLLGHSIEGNWLRLNSASKPIKLIKERLSDTDYVSVSRYGRSVVVVLV